MSLSEERFRAPWGSFSAKFKITAKELSQERTQIDC